jgi:hypothetical protein
MKRQLHQTPISTEHGSCRRGLKKKKKKKKKKKR